MEKIKIYAYGLCYCSICADENLSINEINDYINAHNPTGINSKWKKTEEDFRDGTMNPHSCETEKNRLHYLFVC